MKKIVLLLMMVFMVLVGSVQAEESSDALGVTFDVTYHSAYMWRGFDMYPGGHGRGAIQPSLDIELGSGFGLNLDYIRANQSGYEDGQEFNATVYKQGTLDSLDLASDMEYKLGYTFYTNPNVSLSDSGMQEAFLNVSLPLTERLAPYAGGYYAWNTGSGGIATSEAAGWMAQLGVNYNYTLPSLIGDIMIVDDVNLFAEIWYNDNTWGFLNNVDNNSNSVDSDWSHIVIGCTTDMPFENGWVLTPGVYYQNRLEKDIVDSSDILWATVGLSRRF